MPSSRVTFRRLLILVALTSLVTGIALADAPPTECTTDEYGQGRWEVRVSAGPCPVSCSYDGDSEDFCDSEAECWGIEYEITQLLHTSYDRAVTLVSSESTVVYPLHGLADPCRGDRVTRVGRYECHQQAVKINQESAQTYVQVVVDTEAETVPMSMVLRGDHRQESCKIAGLGRPVPPALDGCVPGCGPFHPKQPIVSTEIMEFQGCFVEFVRDLTTGEILSAALIGDDDEECDFEEGDIDEVEIVIDETSYGFGTFGDGFISSGSESCTCRLIGGRRYCWGRPCPNRR